MLLGVTKQTTLAAYTSNVYSREIILRPHKSYDMLIVHCSWKY